MTELRIYIMSLEKRFHRLLSQALNRDRSVQSSDTGGVNIKQHAALHHSPGVGAEELGSGLKERSH